MASDKRNVKNKISFKIFSKISEKYFNIGKLKKHCHIKENEIILTILNLIYHQGIETLLLILGLFLF